MEMDVIKTTGGAERLVSGSMLAAGETPSVSDDEIAVPSPVKVGGGALLDGKGVNAVTYAPHGLSDCLPNETEVFLVIAQQMCESLKAIIDNLKPSLTVTQGRQNRAAAVVEKAEPREIRLDECLRHDERTISADELLGKNNIHQIV